MWNELYFVPILARALRQSDPRRSLEEAFRRIREMGQQPEYQVGFDQFCCFMEEAATAEGSADASAAGLLRSLLARFTAVDEGSRDDSVSLVLEREGERVAKLGFPPEGGTLSVNDIRPGCHTLLLDTGRVIWERTLAESDLTWAHAFPGEPLDLAADMGEGSSRPTITENLLGGEIVLRVFPGIEDGRIEVELDQSNSSEAMP